MLSQYAVSAQSEPPPRDQINTPGVQQSAAYQPYPPGPPTATATSPADARHHPYHRQSAPNIASTPGDEDVDVDETRRDSGAVRRRITRACDLCHQLRTKCNGEAPCSHCIDFGLSCEYNRQRKKRGKASRKSISQKDESVAAVEPTHPSQDQASEGPSPTQPASAYVTQNQEQRVRSLPNGPNALNIPPNSQTDRGEYQRTSLGDGIINDRHLGDRFLPRSLDQIANLAQKLPQMDTGPVYPREPSVATPSAVSLNGFSLNHLRDRSRSFGAKPVDTRSAHSGSIASQNSGQQANLAGFHHTNGDPFAASSPRASQGASPGFRIGSIGASSFPGFFNPASPAAAGSPSWLNLPSPSTFQQNTNNQSTSLRPLRYPVLQPVIPYIESVIPIPLACDLLELYFASSSTSYLHPSSPYVLGYMFRKQSFLRTVRPRSCSPALLASILWLAAQTSDSSFLTSSPSARGRVCQKLMEITVTLLRPLMHGPQSLEMSAEGMAKSMVNGVALGGLGVSMSGGDQLTAESGGGGPLDIVATYIHLATIVSASEYKAASMRWWNAAWSFARELRLNRELPDNATDPDQSRDADRGSMDLTAASRIGNAALPMDIVSSPAHSLPGFVNEEEREERRRVWWLLFFMDRHLSLCYNQPLTLLDAECENLFQPLSENNWQAGIWPSGTNFRHRGPRLLCTGHGIFGFFMPLMTILGEIVDLNHARAHPRNSQRTARRMMDWDEREAAINSRLEAYARSLTEFEVQASVTNDPMNVAGPSINAQVPGGRKMSDAAIQTKTVVAYGTHIMHVLHILATGKWDPINLLDDNDSWISTPSFISAMGHAVSAADGVADILEYDPDLSYMPWLFGISLLQGSFLLLLIADKLGSEADAAVVTACEKIVRAHEVCVVTLNTEYQRHMRKVMRSALTQVKGRIPADFGEQQARRREVLSLYRWTGDGTGIAL